MTAQEPVGRVFPHPDGRSALSGDLSARPAYPGRSPAAMISSMSTRRVVQQKPPVVDPDWVPWTNDAERQEWQRRYPAIDIVAATEAWRESIGDRNLSSSPDVWMTSWKMSMAKRNRRDDELMDADWLPHPSAVFIALMLMPDDMGESLAATPEERAFRQASGLQLTRWFAEERAGMRLSDVPEDELRTARSWDEQWFRYMSKIGQERTKRNVEIIYQSGVAAGSRGEEPAGEPASVLEPWWMPDPATLKAAKVLLDDLDVTAATEQFHFQFDGRTLESMGACDWIREDEVTDWSTVWLTYLRQVAVSRRERLAREETTKAAQVADAATVREQGGLKLLRGAG